MIPNYVSICIVCDDKFYSSLLKDYLSIEESFFVYTSSFANIRKDKDIYIVITDKISDLDEFTNINALKVLISSNCTKNMIISALRAGVTVFYDHNLELNWLLDLGLHLYIYQRGTACIDIPNIVKVVTKSKYAEKRYGKIQI